MEQGLEAPALHRAECEDRLRATAAEGASERRERKGEKARFAVNRKAGNSRNGDAGPREPGAISETVAVGGGKASKGSRCIAGKPVSRQAEMR